MEKEYICGTNWNCKRGFEYVSEMTIESRKYKGYTMLFQGYKSTPDFIRTLYIKWLLIPKIKIINL